MRLVIADDHGVVRGGLRLLLDRQVDMTVVGEAADGAEAVTQTLAHRPDIAVLDVAMPRLTGLQATREIKALAPDVDVLILSMHDDERYLFEALKAGASGYVLKHEADHYLVDAVRAVARGDSFLTNAAQRALVRTWMEDDSAGPQEPLTPREQEVIKLIAEAHTNREIGAILHLADKTVESHRAKTSCASSECATGWSWCATRSGGGWWSRRRRPSHARNSSRPGTEGRNPPAAGGPGGKRELRRIRAGFRR
jgi:DNA-binding NarL/FixJ family response regulator